MKRTLFILFAIFALFAMADDAGGKDEPRKKKADVDVEITDAQCRIKHNQECSWQLDKKITDVERVSWNSNKKWVLRRGDCIRIEYTIRTQRTCKDKFEEHVTGTVVVKNDGDADTKNLKVVVVLQIRNRGSDWREVDRKQINDDMEVGAHDSESFDFDFDDFEFEDSAEFRVKAIVTLDNQKDCDNAPCKIKEKTRKFECKVVDGKIKGKCAVVTDDISDCTSKLSVTPDKIDPVEICEEKTIKQSIKACNDKCVLKCEKDNQVCNTAKIFAIDKPGDRPGIRPDDSDTECLKIKVKCPKGHNKDKHGKKCGGDECQGKSCDECHGRHCD
jgi:hypothetical protein